MPQKIHTDDWNVITGTAALYKYRPVIVDVINTPVTNSRRNPFPQLEGSEGARLAMQMLQVQVPLDMKMC